MQLPTPHIDFPIASRRRQTPMLVRRRLIEMGPKSGVDDRISKPRVFGATAKHTVPLSIGKSVFRESR
jgi:hypothetical protein